MYVYLAWCSVTLLCCAWPVQAALCLVCVHECTGHQHESVGRPVRCMQRRSSCTLLTCCLSISVMFTYQKGARVVRVVVSGMHVADVRERLPCAAPHVFSPVSCRKKHASSLDHRISFFSAVLLLSSPVWYPEYRSLLPNFTTNARWPSLCNFPTFSYCE